MNDTPKKRGNSVYKSHISLEVRILLLTGVKTFDSDRLNPLAARKACLLIRSLGGEAVKEAPYEQNLSTPALPDRNGKSAAQLSGLSIKLGEGALDINFHGRKKRINITEIRLEEDAGRLIRTGKETTGENSAWMDYSCAGMPSLRIRTAPDFEIGEEAEVFLSELRRRIQYLEILSGPVESVIRCNAYVAIAPYPGEPANFVKLRNLNSFNFVSKAVNSELSRQEEILISGGQVAGESRLWNEAKNTSEPFQVRQGEEKPRFKLLENVPPFRPGPDILEALDNFTIELPALRRKRLMNEYALTEHQAEFICDEKSRADYFEETAAQGANPKSAAQWMASFVIKEFKRLGQNPAGSHLTPERFARILKLLHARRIHGSIAKQTITAALRENRDPREIIREQGWEQLTDRKTIEVIVNAVVEANPQEVRRIRDGDAGPIQFLTGLIMKETGGLAEPTLVKETLKEKLSVSLIYVLSLGGAISGRIGADGAVESGDEQVLRDLLAANENDIADTQPDAKAGRDTRVRVESIQVGRILSEEIVPSDWAILIETIAEKLNSGTANCIVITHGTDTLPYTAPLIYWLFADSGAPIVFAASSTPPGVSSEAARTMKKAVDLALKKTKGVYVVHGGKVLSPLNLKFERIGVDGFRNWNMETPVFSGSSLLTSPLEADHYVLSQLLEDAVNSMCVIRIYPGLRSDYLQSLMDKGVKNFFLELYDTGTAGFREGPYSLKRAFNVGKRRNTHFYCTSQQEGIVDFSGYTSSRILWQTGAVPMGVYTTETAVARFLAASIIADNDEERAELMEVEVAGGAL
ncbi:MAG: asparaginase domain-containing protein [Treponema sp.]|nr:asparaginase domain-containing protein [Treponema sp.]